MKCAKCGAEYQNGEMFCPNCGAELFTGENVEGFKKSDDKTTPADADTPYSIDLEKSDASVNTDIRNTADDDYDIESLGPDIPEKKRKIGFKKKDPSEQKPAKANRSRKGSKRASRIRILKLIGALAAVIIILVIVLFIISMINASKGRKLAEKVPIGRNIEYCITQTGAEFTNTTANVNLRSVSKFSYIYTDDHKIKVSGIELPKWAVMVNVSGSDKVIDSVEYYNFAVLKKGWRGTKCDAQLTQETVSYGMDEKAVGKAMKFDPYYIKKTSDNRTIFCYRYYTIDPDTESERVFNFYVVFNDLNGTVVNAYDGEINYVSYVLGMDPDAPARS